MFRVSLSVRFSVSCLILDPKFDLISLPNSQFYGCKSVGILSNINGRWNLANDFMPIAGAQYGRQSKPNETIWIKR